MYFLCNYSLCLKCAMKQIVVLKVALPLLVFFRFLVSEWILYVWNLNLLHSKHKHHASKKINAAQDAAAWWPCAPRCYCSSVSRVVEGALCCGICLWGSGHSYSEGRGDGENIGIKKDFCGQYWVNRLRFGSFGRRIHFVTNASSSLLQRIGRLWPSSRLPTSIEITVVVYRRSVVLSHFIACIIRLAVDNELKRDRLMEDRSQPTGWVGKAFEAKLVSY